HIVLTIPTRPTNNHLIPLSRLHSPFSLRLPSPPTSTLFPYTTLLRSSSPPTPPSTPPSSPPSPRPQPPGTARLTVTVAGGNGPRSEEHTSELQSQSNVVCRLLLEKKNNFLLNTSSRLHHRITPVTHLT